MRTVHSINAAWCTVDLNEYGRVTIADRTTTPMVHVHVASDPDTCQALGEALLEMARVMREAELRKLTESLGVKDELPNGVRFDR